MSRPSLRAAIDAMCKSCIYDPGSGNGAWREQVQACSSAHCPLHRLRPLSRPKTHRDGAAGSPVEQQPFSRLQGQKNGLPDPAFGTSEGGAA